MDEGDREGVGGREKDTERVKQRGEKDRKEREILEAKNKI